MQNKIVKTTIYFLLGFSISFNCFSQSTSGYKIEFTVKGLTDSVVYLGNHYGEKRYLQDTAAVNEGGYILFEGEKELKNGVYFLYGKTIYHELVIDEKQFSVTMNKENPMEDMTITGSQANEDFRKFQLAMIAHQKAIRELTSLLDSTSTKEDSISVYDRMKALNVENEIKREELLQIVGDNYVKQILTLMNLSPELKFESDSLTVEEKRKRYNDFRKGYFDGLDFESGGLVRTPFFHSKLMEYIDRVVIQNPDSIIVAVDELLDKSANNEELYRYIMVNMFDKYQNPKIMGMDKVFIHISDEYYLKGKASWADDEMIKKLKEELVFHRENQLGMQAPQIVWVDTLDQASNLYAIEAEFLILYFYSPTCGHCKKKTPVLLDAYHKLEGKAEVAAVCIDTDIDKWKQFIKDLGLDWRNYADPHLRSNFRMQYNVRSTPVLYILDKEKKIIAKKLDVDQVEGFIRDQIRLSEMAKS